MLPILKLEFLETQNVPLRMVFASLVTFVKPGAPCLLKSILNTTTGPPEVIFKENIVGIMQIESHSTRMKHINNEK